MLGLINASLDEVYDLCSDRHDPKVYTPDDSPDIDRALKRIAGFDMSGRDAVAWWEIVDRLFAAGYVHEAVLAQQHAVPLLPDLAGAAQSPRIQNMYGEVVDQETGQNLIKSFHRTISEVIRDFPVLASPTRFSLSDARVISLDLEEVTARGSGASAIRQTAVMYMLSRQILTRDYYLDETEFSSAAREGVLPEDYLEFQVKRTRSMKQVPKRLCIDEFHRTGGIPGLNAQVLQDIREGRKHNSQIAIASQLVTDFPDEILQMSSSMHVCSASSDSAVNALSSAFGLSEVEEEVIKADLHGPSRQGAPQFLISRTKEGVVRQLLWLTLGPVELWALSTTSEDMALRRILYDRLGPGRARQALARRFPSGSARVELDARRIEYGKHGGRMSGQAEAGLIGQLAEEMEKQALMLASA